jgi:hypothetical protein
MLDDLDRELQRRGHRFVRYADDLRVYVRSERAAGRALEGLTRYVERKLKLRVNRKKSGVDSAFRRGLLGFGFFRRQGEVRVRVDTAARRAVKARIRRLTARNWGVSMAARIAAVNRFILGWCAYYALAETPSVFAELDQWVRRRLRQCQWKQWKRVRTKARALVSLGINRGQAWKWANTRRGSWRVAGSAILQRALPIDHWRRLGFAGFSDSYGRVRVGW